uniref:Uncharacterized protein n=1 Tax=Avena sativa TaxID=4498 RepID=A0ACD5WQM9_AVESA
MAEQRKDLVALFRNICRVAPAATQQFIKGLLVTALSSAEATVEDVEVTLTLLYRLGEIVGEEEIRMGTGMLGELVPMLLSARFSCHTHRLVASVYLETVTRYIKFTQDNVQYVPHLLAAFLDERGIHHQNSNVSRRAGYLFMKAVKLLKAKLVPYLDTILQSLEDVLGQFTVMDWANKEAKFSSSEDGSQIFEAVGLLIGIEEVSPEKQVQCLTALLNPLCHQFSLEKYFCEERRGNDPTVIFSVTLISWAKDMVEFLVLINQIVGKFNSSASGILEDVFPTIASRLSLILSQDAFSTGPAGNTEEMRELQELQRTLYTFLHGMVTHDLSTILLAPTCRQYLETIMQLLLYTSCSHKDILLRKACVQIFIRLIKDWCTTSKADDKLPGFRVFMIEKFATGCCLYSVLDKSFDLRDANTLVLFGEIVMAQKIMYERFGEDFVVNFVAKGLPEAHCPPDLAEQYYQKLQGNDTKAFRSFYQSLIEKIRQQQNGSLVFR